MWLGRDSGFYAQTCYTTVFGQGIKNFSKNVFMYSEGLCFSEGVVWTTYPKQILQNFL